MRYLICALLFFVGAVAAAALPEGLSVSTPMTDSFMYNTTMRSCQDVASGAVSASYGAQGFELIDVAVSWNPANDESLTLTSMSVEITGPQFDGGKVTEKLDLVNEAPLAFAPGFKLSLKKGEQIQSGQMCSLRFGNINVKSSGKAAGKLIVTGFTSGGKTVEASLPFALHIIEPSN